jgi:hypothetical protein
MPTRGMKNRTTAFHPIVKVNNPSSAQRRAQRIIFLFFFYFLNCLKNLQSLSHIITNKMPSIELLVVCCLLYECCYVPISGTLRNPENVLQQ